MSESEETPAQRQARIRRQKREAKINANAQERLDKITQLSGRTPESGMSRQNLAKATGTDKTNSIIVRRDTPASTPGEATPTTSVSQGPSPLPTPGPAQSQDSNDGQQGEIEQQFLRALLQGAEPGAGAGAGDNNAGPQGQPQPGFLDSDDPIRKMLGSMMGASGVDGDPNVPPNINFSPDDIAQATGLPSFLTKAFMGGQATPPTAEEARSTAVWRILHLIFALLAGIYLVFSIAHATAAFGENPPAPATFLNPFSVFVIGEVVLHTSRILLAGPSGKSGPRLWLQMTKDFASDGALSVFLLGLASWWKGGA
ncbi:hypothetical protein DV737_g4934, partial [Chaetothyriales sp. CBS 132003]